MNFLELLKKIDWEGPSIESGMGTYLNESTDVRSRDYLEFAKKDLKGACIQGLINAITNAKRAIDCCVDNIILAIGYDYKKIGANKTLLEFINNHNFNMNANTKFRFIDALEIAPTKLISKLRKLRNKVEHNYFCPTEDEAQMAVELAELFIGYLGNKIFFDELFFEGKYGKLSVRHFDRKSHSFKIICQTNESFLCEGKISSDSVEYLPLIKLCLTFDPNKDTGKDFIKSLSKNRGQVSL